MYSHAGQMRWDQNGTRQSEIERSLNRHQGGALASEIGIRAAHSIQKDQRKLGSYLPAEKRSTPQQQHGVRSPLKMTLEEKLRRKVFRETKITQRRILDRRFPLRKAMQQNARKPANRPPRNKGEVLRQISAVKIRTNTASESTRQTLAQNDANGRPE